MSARVVERGGESEVQFLFSDPERLLPVWVNGRLELTRWGCRRGESRALPATGWARLETLEAGGWRAWSPVEAVTKRPRIEVVFIDKDYLVPAK